MNRRLLTTTVTLSALMAALSGWTATAPAVAAPPVLAALAIGQSSDPEAVYNDGVTKFNNNDFDGAITAFTKAIELRKGKFSDASFNRGLAYEQKPDLDKAIADFTTVITLKPKLVDAYLERGRCYAAKGAVQSALPDFAKVLELKPGMTDVYLARGDAYLNAKQPDNAIADYTAYASKAQPVDKSVYMNRGTAYLGKGSFDPAIADFDKYIATLAPGDKTAQDAYVSRADAYMGKKDYKSAIGDYSKYLALKTGDLYGLRQRGLAYLLSDDYTHAIQDFDSVLAKAPGDKAAAQNKLVALSKGKGGNPQSIIDASTPLIQADPKNVGALSTRAGAYVAMKNYSPAIADYTAILAVNPSDATALYNRAVAYGLTDQYDKSIVDFTSYINVKPDDAAAYNGRGLAYGKQGKWALAAKDFGTYSGKKPEDTDALKNLGIALYNTQDKANYSASLKALQAYDIKKPGDKDTPGIEGAEMSALGIDATETLRKAVERDPTNVDALYNLGVAYSNQKKYSEAAATFTKELAIKAGDTTALQNRAAAYYNIGLAGGTNSAAAYDKAIADATSLLTANPGNKDAILLRADSEFQAKKFAAAGADYDKYGATAGPSDPQAKYAVGQSVNSSINAKDFAGVVKSTTAAIAADPNEPSNYNYRALANLQTKNYADAVKDLVKYTSMKPDDSTAYYNLGVAYAGAGDNANAASSFEKAVSLKADYYEAASQAAGTYQKLAAADSTDSAKANPEFDKAISMYDKASTIKGTGKEAADAMYNKAVAIEAKAKANDNDSATLKLAIEAWNKWLTLAPNDAEAPKIKQHVTDLKAQVEREG